MTKKEQHPGGVKLTAKTARTLAMQGLWKTAITRTERKKDTVKISRRKVRR